MHDQEPQSSFYDAGTTQAVQKLQLVHAGSTQYGILVEEIFAVVAWRDPVPLPHAPKSILGVVSIQGRMLTVLDLARLREADSNKSASSAPGYIVALEGDEQLALAVAEVGNIIQLAEVDFDRDSASVGKLVKVLQNEDAEINVLNLEELFSHAIQGRERRRRRF